MNKNLKFKTLNFQRDQRFGGVPKYTFSKLYKLAVSGLYPYLNKYLLSNMVLIVLFGLLYVFLKIKLMKYLIIILGFLLVIIAVTKLIVFPNLNNNYEIRKIFT